jgi:hypothetical protein
LFTQSTIQFKIPSETTDVLVLLWCVRIFKHDFSQKYYSDHLDYGMLLTENAVYLLFWIFFLNFIIVYNSLRHKKKTAVITVYLSVSKKNDYFFHHYSKNCRDIFQKIIFVAKEYFYIASHKFYSIHILNIYISILMAFDNFQDVHA